MTVPNFLRASNPDDPAEQAEAERVNKIIVEIIREMAEYDGSDNDCGERVCDFCIACGSEVPPKHKDDCIVLKAQKLAHDADIRLLDDIAEEEESEG